MGGISPINLGYLLGARAVCTGRRTTPNKNTKHIQPWNNWQQYIPKDSFKSIISPCKPLKTAPPHIFPTGKNNAEARNGLELRMNGEAHGLALGGAGAAQLGAQGHGCQDDLVVGEVVPALPTTKFLA